MRAIIIKNAIREGAGLIENVLTDEGIAWDAIDLDAGDPFPAPEKYDMIFLLGGPDSATDDTAKMQWEREAVAGILREEIPFFGICLGMQVLGLTAGGSLAKSPYPEIGVRDPVGRLFCITLTTEGGTDPLCAGLPASVPVFQLHGETVVPARGITVLATGDLCRVQLIKTGTYAYGIQGHLEATHDMIIRWADEDPDLATLDRDRLIADFAQYEGEYAKNARIILKNFIAIARERAQRAHGR
ncbi:MAG: type 1 glutamine amidotransferase [Methanomicrobiaceae archaeon]|nr:type 1 glutamine amidotransferase [Methanomicrobiaceae archaeon]